MPAIKKKDMTWTQLNDALRTTTDEAVLRKMMKEEAHTKNRYNWKLRIHQRLNRLRREREQAALLAK